MSRLLLQLRAILALVFLGLTLVFLIFAVWHDVFLVFLSFPMGYLLVIILVILGLYETLDITKAHVSQLRSKKGPVSQGKKAGA